jgi:hypothetical protein
MSYVRTIIYEPKIFLRKGKNWFQSLPNARGHLDRQEKSVQKIKDAVSHYH